MNSTSSNNPSLASHESNAHSNVRVELTAHPSEEKRVTRARLALEKAQKRLEKAELLAKKRQERIANMSDEKRERYFKRREDLDARRAYKSTLSKDEKRELCLMAREERIEKKRLKLEKLPEKERKRCVLSKEERKERKQKYQYLKTKWVEDFPKELDVVIMDGNNMRAGGPHRKSRVQIIEYAEKAQDHLKVPVICYFDGTFKADNSENGLVTVKYSKDIIADDLIVEDAKAVTNPLVITVDRGLALRILEIGGTVMRNGTFKRSFESK